MPFHHQRFIQILPPAQEQRDALTKAKKEYDALPELEKAWRAYNHGPDHALYDIVEAYRASADGGSKRPDGWKPSDTHLLAMWQALNVIDEYWT